MTARIRSVGGRGSWRETRRGDSGRSMRGEVEVRAVCPKCGSGQYAHNGVTGDVIYRKCLKCGYKGKVLRVTTAEVLEVVLRGED